MSIRTVLLVGLSLGTTNCLLSPYSQQSFDSESAISFGGYSFYAGSKIEIQACANQDLFLSEFCVPNPAKGIQFETLATLHASKTVSYTDSFALKWYAWETTIALPRKYWHNNGPLPPSPRSPAAATVRVLDNDNGTYTYITDPATCPQPPGYAQLGTHDWHCAFDPQSPDSNVGVIVLAKGY